MATRRVSFGSCSKQTKPQPLWPLIAARRPDLWAFLGDVVYADHAILLKLRRPANETDLANAYALQETHPAYAAFRASGIAFIATIDDHDYGENDGDRHMEEDLKRASLRHFLRFTRARADDPHWACTSISSAACPPAHVGTWTSYELGEGGRRVKVILLDNRSQRDGYADAGQDMYGPVQWSWLEAQLTAEPRPAVTLIGTGIQILSQGDPYVSENFARLPQSKARLLALLAVHNVSGVVLLSGDVHFAELNAMRVPAVGYPGLGVLELTSSGMTHAWSGPLKRLIVGSCILGSTRVGNWHNDVNWGEVDVAFEGQGGPEITLRIMGARPRESVWERAAERLRALASPIPPADALQPPWGGPDEGASKLESFVALEHTVPLAALARTRPPDAGALALARACVAEPLSHGLTAPCAALLASCAPLPTALMWARLYAGHALLLSLLGSAALFVLVALPWALCGPYPRWYIRAIKGEAPTRGEVLTPWRWGWEWPTHGARAASAAACTIGLAWLAAYIDSLH
jgi:alkaline phosphatase D